MGKIFRALDRNFDGSLSKKEIELALKRVGMTNKRGEADRIFTMMDMDGNGEIEFAEWCRAGVDKKKFLCKHNL